MVAVAGTGLKREIKLHQFFTLAFGTIVGVGWIIVMGQWLSRGGPFGASLAFVVGGAVMCAIGVCYAKLAARYPVTGGAVAYAYNVFGEGAAFVVGWFLALTYLAASGFAVVSTSWVLEALLPGLRGPALYTMLGSEVHGGTLLIGFALLAVIAAANLRGAGSTAKLQDLITYGLLVLGVLIVSIGFSKGDPANLVPYFGDGSAPSQAVHGFFAVLATTPFFLAGFDVIPQAMGERDDTTDLRRITTVIVAAIVLAMAFYLAVILGTAVLLPRDRIVGLDLPVAEAFEIALSSSLVGRLVLLCGLFGILSSWNALFYSGARVLYALGHARLLPGALAETSARGAPHNAILFVTATSAGAALLGKGAVLPIVNTHGAVMSAVFLAMSAAAWRLARRGEISFARPALGSAIIAIAVVASLALVCIALWQSFEARTQAVPFEWLVIGVWGMLAGAVWLRIRSTQSRMSPAERALILSNW